MPTTIVVIVEAEADFRHATCLADRVVLKHAPDWLDSDQLDFERKWTGLEANTRFTRWREINDLAKAQTKAGFGSGLLGFGSGTSKGYDYAATRKVILLCAAMSKRPKSILLVRDLDNQPAERRASIENACSEQSKFAIVLALPNPKRETWALNGFVEKPHEKDALTSLHQELGFHPCHQAEQLTAQAEGAKRDAKSTLNHLTSGIHDRERECWETVDLRILHERGKATGLTDFLNEVEQKLVPLICGNC